MTFHTPTIGILAFGSLIWKSGAEIDKKIERRVPQKTPFPVEFAWYSGATRGGAPTLVRVTKGGARVDGQILILKQDVTKEEATDMLWRRETGNESTNKSYPALKTSRAVRVRTLSQFAKLNIVIYTDFYAKSKKRNPKARNLARQAIKSVAKAKEGKDGISYLIKVKKAGVKTPLMSEFEKEVLKQTGTESLEEALAAQKTRNNKN